MKVCVQSLDETLHRGTVLTIDRCQRADRPFVLGWYPTTSTQCHGDTARGKVPLMKILIAYATSEGHTRDIARTTARSWLMNK